MSSLREASTFMSRKDVIPMASTSTRLDKKELSTRVTDMKFMQKSAETSQRIKLNQTAQEIVDESKWVNPTVKDLALMRPHGAKSVSFEEVSETSGLSGHSENSTEAGLVQVINAKGEIVNQDLLENVSLDRQHSDLNRLLRGRRSFGNFNPKLEATQTAMKSKSLAIKDEMEQIDDDELADMIAHSKSASKRVNLDNNSNYKNKNNQQASRGGSFMDKLNKFKESKLAAGTSTPGFIALEDNGSRGKGNDTVAAAQKDRGNQKRSRNDNQHDNNFGHMSMRDQQKRRKI